MGEGAFAEQLGALRGAPSRSVGALSPTAWRPAGGGPERAPKGLCGRGLAYLRSVSATAGCPRLC
eukprot:15480168-Alexandrium_andersonii.AAC.1